MSEPTERCAHEYRDIQGSNVVRLTCGRARAQHADWELYQAANVHRFTTKKLPPCGDPDCRVSTSIADTVTAGKFGPDEHGFFDEPCATCEAFFTRLLASSHQIDGDAK